MRAFTASTSGHGEPVTIYRVLARLPEDYLLLRRSEVSLCTYNPGFPEELCLRADRRTLIGWWRGDLTLRQARGAGLVLDGQCEWVLAFPRWFERYLFAPVAPVPAPRLRARLTPVRRPDLTGEFSHSGALEGRSTAVP